MNNTTRELMDYVNSLSYEELEVVLEKARELLNEVTTDSTV